MLASVARRYGLGQVVAIDPHAGLSYLDDHVAPAYQDPTFSEFLASLKFTGLEENVEARRDFSRNVAADWPRRIRLLWIDGDHSGCKENYDLFSPYLAEGAVIAFHDWLHTFEGPIRVVCGRDSPL
jgi:Methyltransferase domain